MQSLFFLRTKNFETVRHVSNPLLLQESAGSAQRSSESLVDLVGRKQRSAGFLDTSSAHTRAKSNFAKVGYAVRHVALLAVAWTGFISLLLLLLSLSRIDCYYERVLNRPLLAFFPPRPSCALTQYASLD